MKRILVLRCRALGDARLATPRLRFDLRCSPCGLTRYPLPGHPCMNDLTSLEVSARLRQLHAERKSR